MSENLDPVERPVERREETVVTRQPGYTASEQVTQDVAAERRQWYIEISRILWTVAGIVEILLGFRFVLKLLAANAHSGFAAFIYSVSGPFAGPFQSLFATPTFGSSSIEVNTLVAMAVYALLAWVIVRVFHILLERPRARTVARSTRERTTSGPDRNQPIQTPSS